MKDQEIYKRAKEVEYELNEMRKQWVNMYELITKLMEDTYTEDYKDTDIEYNKCINCGYSDCDKSGIRCMLEYKDRPCK